MKDCLKAKNKKYYNEKVKNLEKSFQCDKCGEKFKFQRKLEFHNNIHLGLKPFKCDEDGCDYASHDKDKLWAHKAAHRHKLKPPNICDVCGAEYRDMTSYQKHLLKIKASKIPISNVLTVKKY